MTHIFIPQFYESTFFPSIVLRVPNNTAGIGTQYPSLKIIIHHNPPKMEDQTSYSNCKPATPTKPKSSNTIHHANPFTKLINEINDKSNVEKSWNCSLFCTGYLPNPTADGPSDQNLVEHMDPTMEEFTTQKVHLPPTDPKMDKHCGVQ